MSSSIAVSGINSSGSEAGSMTSCTGDEMETNMDEFDPVIEIDRPSVIVRNTAYRRS